MERSAWFLFARAGFLAGVLLAMAGCSEERAPEEEAASVPPAPEAVAGAGERPRTVLDGSRWYLAEIRLANGETVRPEDPGNYRFWFRPDGILAMRLKCNLASTDWSAAPAGKGRGTLAAAAPVATHAGCPKPSLDQRIVHRVGALASYALDGTRLHLVLKGGESYVLEPAGGPD